MKKLVFMSNRTFTVSITIDVYDDVASDTELDFNLIYWMLRK